jgi:hypothetical protein
MEVIQMSGGGNNMTRPQRIGRRPWGKVILKVVMYGKMPKLGYN